MRLQLVPLLRQLPGQVPVLTVPCYVAQGDNNPGGKLPYRGHGELRGCRETFVTQTSTDSIGPY
ncbi:hypothetical protein DPMN_128869 [Dreissena polymorpha]|uniref:Uncharacterized protein n=1 Tax=Dreissena polymorpha TaxID=45954 RepID=A0A9D4K014_DREPO|nr:hypothetical protein DPMN_128869 [Dreissena polymorpha]